MDKLNDQITHYWPTNWLIKCFLWIIDWQVNKTGHDRNLNWIYINISNIFVHVNVLKLWKSSFFLIFENDFSKFVILIILILVFFAYSLSLTITPSTAIQGSNEFIFCHFFFSWEFVFAKFYIRGEFILYLSMVSDEWIQVLIY